MSWLDNVDIIFEENDLLSMNVDAIACPVTTGLLEYGQISRKIFGMAPSEFMAELSEIKKSRRTNSLTIGEAVSPDTKISVPVDTCKHIICVALWGHHNEYSRNLFYKAYINTLREAFRLGSRSVALPFMAYDGHIRECSHALVRVIIDLDALKRSADFPVEELFFVSNNQAQIEFLNREATVQIY